MAIQKCARLKGKARMTCEKRETPTVTHFVALKGGRIGVVKAPIPDRVADFKLGDKVRVKEGRRTLSGKVYQYPAIFPLSGEDYNVVGVKVKGRKYKGHRYPANLYKLRFVKKGG